MKSELIVDVQPGEVSIALLEDGRLVSLQKEARNIAYAVGDIYLAKVKKLMPGLNAAFVNVGYDKDAFLHYLDLGSRFTTYAEFLKQLFADRKKLPKVPQLKLLPEIDKHGSITNTLTPGQELLVQIVKEPISSKGPRLTTELSFTGRYMVLTPFCDKVSISQKIKSPEEKARLRQLIESIKPKNFGVIVRTSAEGKRVAELNHELKSLLQSFEDACAKAQKSEAPALVFEEENRVVGMLRDIFSPSFENIHVNDPEIHAQIQKYVNLIAPERRDIVKLYSRPEPIFDTFSITRQIKSSFGKTVSFKSGAYIIIEHTEALHVIDVNSGNRTKAGSDQETNALEVNLRAADEIARQLRLRDMGGIIVVDFIDMAKNEHRQQLYEHMREVMANDRARHNILPLSKFGLMQITRQRVRPVLDITVDEECPSCFGKGYVHPSILFTDTLYEKLEYVINTLGLRDFIMYVHPYVDAYIKKGLLSNMYRTWRRRLGRCFKVMPDESLAYLQYRVLDKDRNEVKLRDEKDMSRSSATKTNSKAQNRGNDSADEQPAAKAAQPQKTQKQAQKAQPAKAKAETAEAPKPQPKPQPKSDVKPETKAKPKTQPEPKAEAPAEAAEQPDAPVSAPAAEAPAPEAADKPKRARKKPQPKPDAPEADSAEQPAEAPVALIPEHFAADQLPADAAEDDGPETDVDADGTEATPAKKRRRRRRRPKKSGGAEGAETDAIEPDGQEITTDIEPQE
ncbi:MAG: Rne/Rng family ribonuclease [Bacteroidales bacterium]|nr:Rne/Rng family ribonuclease [Bacteroidales bacterium]